jgi:indolepyruvate ferredoxin oxidoreductase
VYFEPGVNEELAATAVWGTQMVGMPKYGDAKHDGVFSIWYGKGPGVDRAGDAIKHGNLVGTSQFGGVLALCGDDHTCKSSTAPHQSEHAMMASSMPVLHPCGVEETLDYGLMGIALSRYSGCWIGMKVTTVSMDSSESIGCGLDKVTLVDPPGGVLDVHARVDELKLVKAEDRLHTMKLPAVREWWYHNAVDKVRVGATGPAKLGILTAGKSFTDVKKALERMRLVDDKAIAAAGISVFKLGMTYPLEPRRVSEWAKQCDVILVVEEKRSFIEDQLKDVLYNEPKRPKIVGKKDEQGRVLFRESMQLEPFEIEEVIRGRIGWKPAETSSAKPIQAPVRTPYFCAGCPHNTSTMCRRARARRRGSGAIPWRCSWRAGTPFRTPRWAERASTGSGCTALWTASSRTCSRTWATARTPTAGLWQCARRCRQTALHP